MFLKIQPFFYSIVYLLGLEMIVFRHDLTIYVVIGLIFLALFQSKKLGKRWLFCILPLLTTIFSVGMLYLVTVGLEKQLFIVIATLVYYFSIFGFFRLSSYQKDQTAQAMIAASSFATAFFAFGSAYGFYLNFLVPLYSLMLVYLSVSLLLSLQYLLIIKAEKIRLVWIYSFILALTMGEIAWTVNFWPFGYLTAGSISLILYYILWELVRGHFLEKLSKKRTILNLVTFSLMITMVLLSSKWIPVF